MKKYICFHCQEEVKPLGFWKILFCPKCHRHITDNGDGFYKVCDVCGANLPPDAKRCLRCGYHFAVEKAVENYDMNVYFGQNQWVSWMFLIFVLIIGIIVAVGILYVSFYVAAVAFLIGAFLFTLNFLRSRLHW